jgi:hypothetical protein
VANTIRVAAYKPPLGQYNVAFNESFLDGEKIINFKSTIDQGKRT